jgi:DNA repair exonuclease SbcCD ATPase subunit
MARGGINLALVREARAALLGRGRRPSIDAVRIELGNTGSKSTISRYLKELDTTASPSPDAAAPASVIDQRLMSVVQALRTQLLEQAQATVDEEQARGAEREQQLRDQVQTLEAQHRRAQEQLAQLNSQLRDELAQRQQQAVAQEKQDEVLRVARQDVHGLNVTLSERAALIAQLQASHQHTRDNLEHFRQQSHEQYAAQQRQHEQFRQDSHQQQRKLELLLSQAQRRAAQLQEELSALQLSLSLERQKVRDQQQHTTQLERRVERLSEERQQLLAARLSLSEQLRQTSAALSELSGQREQLSIDLAVCHSRLAAYTAGGFAATGGQPSGLSQAGWAVDPSAAARRQR